MTTARLLIGNASTRLAELDTGSIQTVITSPPYFGLRDYGVNGQMGMESTPKEYVQSLVRVFRDIRRVLSDDGTLWLNLGDSYNAAGRKGHGTRQGYKQGTNRASKTGQDTGRPSDPALKEKDLIGIPWRVAFALQADGWYLRQDIIWAKPNAMPESVTDRCTKSHEYLFLLSKSAKYFYDHEASKERSVKGAAGSTFNSGKTGIHQMGRSSEKPRDSNDEMRNRRDVWTIPTKPFKGAHFAVMPEALVEPCVLAGSAEGDLVLDPFTGSGTVGVVALRHQRNFIGVELNPLYAGMAEKRITDDGPMLNIVEVVASNQGDTHE